MKQETLTQTQVETKTVTLKIDNSNTGDYTGRIYVGSQKVPCDVILDTGSSTLALDGKKYDPKQDNNAVNTGLVQVAQYGSGSWVGTVENTNVNLKV